MLGGNWLGLGECRACIFGVSVQGLGLQFQGWVQAARA